MDEIAKLKQEIEQLKKDLKDLSTRRIKQEMILPDAVKMRHIGEGVRFIRGGLAADLPAKGDGTASGFAIYYAYDSKILLIWDGTSWGEITVS